MSFSIGIGTCAEVFTIGSREIAYKRAFPRWENQLSNDYVTHLAIVAAMKNYENMELAINIPTPYQYITAENDKWHMSLGASLPKTTERHPVLVSERIRPLVATTSTMLIGAYCKPDEQTAALGDARNVDCLARVYLGRSTAPKYTTPFTLRNFELTLNRIRDLHLPDVELARTIAQTLALIHWEAESDGRDIEFVLGSPPASSAGAPGTNWMGSMWVLDFNQCEPITMDEVGCTRAAAAFWDNDPYYPRPTNLAETKLWLEFENEYLSMSSSILKCRDREIKKLPATFMDYVKIVGKQRFPNGAANQGPPRAAPLTPPRSSPEISMPIRDRARSSRYRSNENRSGRSLIILEELEQRQI